ncbi:MAG: hypothetical protein ACYCVN_07590 [Acidimicrobiales bacterium]
MDPPREGPEGACREVVAVGSQGVPAGDPAVVPAVARAVGSQGVPADLADAAVPEWAAAAPTNAGHVAGDVISRSWSRPR